LVKAQHQSKKVEQSMVLHLLISSLELTAKLPKLRYNPNIQYDAVKLQASTPNHIDITALSERVKLKPDGSPQRFVVFNRIILCSSGGERVGHELEEESSAVNLKLTIFATFFDTKQHDNLDEHSPKIEEIGIAQLFCSPIEGTVTKNVIFHDRRTSRITGKLTATVYYNREKIFAPNSVGSFPDKHYRPNPQEFAFLLAREQRRSQAARRTTSLNSADKNRVTFDNINEHLVQLEARRNSISTLPEPYTTRIPRMVSPVKKSRNLTPRLRETAMSVGYVKNKWPDETLSMQERSLYKLFLTEQRRLGLLREVESQLHKRFLVFILYLVLITITYQCTQTGCTQEKS